MEQWPARIDSGDSIERDGFTLTVTIEHDHDSGTPWDNSDGHGPVSDWTSRAKLPGELILSDDNPSGLRSTCNRRFYDYAEACRIAARDGWGFLPGPLVVKQNSGGKWHAWVGRDDGRGDCLFNTGGHDDSHAAVRQVYAMHRATFPSDRAYAAKAAYSDYERLRAWCNDDWSYVGVIVTASRNGITLSIASLWGIESDAADYIRTVTYELSNGAIAEARDAIAALND